MGDHRTRFTELQDAQKQLDSTLKLKLGDQLAGKELKFSNILAAIPLQISNLSNGLSMGESSMLRLGTGSHKSDSNSIDTHLPQIDFPTFDGTNPRSWIRKCNNYFKSMPSVPESQKVLLAIMHFEGKAQLWFQLLNVGDLVLTWTEFMGLVCTRFDMLPVSDVIVELKELKQTGSYEDYVERFEELRAYILLRDRYRYSEDYFIASFINGLDEELQSFLHIFQPTTIVDIIELGRKPLNTLDEITQRSQPLGEDEDYLEAQQAIVLGISDVEIHLFQPVEEIADLVQIVVLTNDAADVKPPLTFNPFLDEYSGISNDVLQSRTPKIYLSVSSQFLSPSGNAERQFKKGIGTKIAHAMRLSEIAVATGTSTRGGGLGYGETDALESVVTASAKRIDRHLLDVLYKQYKFKEHCFAINRYLLLGQGDFVQYLMDIVGPGLTEAINISRPDVLVPVLLREDLQAFIVILPYLQFKNLEFKMCSSDISHNMLEGGFQVHINSDNLVSLNISCIVRLLGCCDNGKTRLLLFDYISNGSLAGFLHEKKIFLDWNARYDIIVGATQELTELHHDCIPPMVRRDINNNTILIGQKFEAFLADYGVAKLMSTSENEYWSPHSQLLLNSYWDSPRTEASQLMTRRQHFKDVDGNFKVALLSVLGSHFIISKNRKISKVFDPRSISDIESSKWENEKYSYRKISTMILGDKDHLQEGVMS